MRETFIQNNQIQDFIPLTHQEREQARGASINVWTQGMRLLGGNSCVEVISSNPSYARILLTKDPECEDKDLKADFKIDRMQSDMGKKIFCVLESFTFYVSDGGYVMKTTSFQNEGEEPFVVGKHEVSKKELEELFKTMKLSRRIEDGIVPSKES